MKKCSIFVFLIIFLTVVASCGNNQDDSNITMGSDYYFSEDQVVLNEIKGDILCSCFNEKFYIVTEYEGKSYLNIYNLNDKEFSNLPLSLEEAEKVKTISVNGDNINIIIKNTNEEYFLLKINNDGSENKRTSIDNVEEYGMNRIITDDSGRVIFSNSKDITVYDSELNLIGNIHDANSIISVSINKSGEIRAIIGKNIDLYFGKTPEYYLCDINIDKMTIKRIIKLEGEPANGKILIDNDFFDACIRMSDGIYVFENGKIKKQFDYNYSYLTQDDTSKIMSINENEYSVVFSDEESCNLLIYSKEEKDVLEGKTVITFGCFGEEAALLQTVVDFNRNNEDYFVEIKDYGLDKDGTNKFNLDISDGKGPDVFCVGGYQSLDNLIAKGICENLDAFFYNDKEISKDEIIDSFFKATDYDGSTYMITDSFSISTLVVHQNDYMGEFGCSSDEFEKYISSSKEGAKILFTDLPSIDLFAFFVENSLRYYIDYENAECHFDDYGFRAIMKICLEHGKNIDNNELNDLSKSDIIEMYRGGDALFMFDPTMSEMNWIKELFGDEMIFCGYPEMGSFFYPNNEICMNTKSDNKDGAWEFMKYFIMPEHQAYIAAGDGDLIPTRIDSYENLKHRMSIEEDYIDDYGNYIEALDNPVDIKDLEYFDELINHTDKFVDINLDMEKVLFDEASSYFNGEHDLNTSIELIENRVNTYIKEHK